MSECPDCGSQKIWKAGFRTRSDGTMVRRFQCADCGRRFSAQKPFNQSEIAFQGGDRLSGSVLQFGDKDLVRSRQFRPRKVGSQNVSVVRRKDVFSHSKQPHNVYYEGKHINTPVTFGSKQGRRMETTQKLVNSKALTAELNSKLVELSMQLHRNGKSKRTIVETTKMLKILVKRGADLYNPESVKEVIANASNWAPSTKRTMTNTYSRFAKFVKLQWEKPVYRAQSKKPFIPLEKEVDALISSCGKKMATFLQTMKETGARCGEVEQLKWEDIDFEQGLIYINDPEKHSDARILKVSHKLMGMLSMLKRTQSSDEKRIWTATGNARRSNFYKQRKRAAYKLQNMNFFKIRFHTFRHWKATTEYHKTRDLLHVQRLLGHKSINSTMVYTQLIENTDGDNYHFATAKTEAEAEPLIMKGFEYVATTPQNVMLFRKRK